MLIATFRRQMTRPMSRTWPRQSFDHDRENLDRNSSNISDRTWTNIWLNWFMNVLYNTDNLWSITYDLDTATINFCLDRSFAFQLILVTNPWLLYTENTLFTTSASRFLSLAFKTILVKWSHGRSSSWRIWTFCFCWGIVWLVSPFFSCLSLSALTLINVCFCTPGIEITYSVV